MRKRLAVFVGLMMLGLWVPQASAKHQCICTKQYSPVCARIGKTVKTYSNACVARCSHAKICAQGKCRGCPVFRLAKPAPGCRYIWRWKGCCRYPKLICKKRKPYCTKLSCRKCNKRCLAKKRACIHNARRFNYNGVRKVRRACRNAGYRVRHKCLCAWAFRKASSAVILRGMRGCLLRKCKRIRCCRKGRKLCIPHAPNVRCVRAPCCKKLVCAPLRCK